MRNMGRAIVAVGAAVYLLSAGAASAAPRHHYPVPETFWAGVIQEEQRPGSDPVGANDWKCKPSPSHPDPVVLVHGLFADKTDNWATISPLLADAGYCVFALTYGTDPGSFPGQQFGGLIAMERSAHELAAFVDRVLSATHAKKVDIVGHSEGATMPEYYLKFLGGGAKVDHFVGVAGVEHGTNVLEAGTLESIGALFGYHGGAPIQNYCASCQEFVAGSPFIRHLDAGGLAVPGVTYTMIATRYDELVQPYNSGFINSPRATNITLQAQCPLDFSDHLAAIADPQTNADVLNALDPSHPVVVPCDLVLPIIG